MILQAHVFIFTAWMVLLTAQASLISLKREDLHRRLGLVATVLIPLMVITGFGAEIYSQRFYSPKFPSNLAFFAMPVMEMSAFGALSTAALLMRRDPPAHKRLILLATSWILAAAYNRWLGEPLYKLFGDGYLGMLAVFLAGPNLLMLVLTAYDLITRRRLHRVYLITVPILLAGEALTSFLYHNSGLRLIRLRDDCAAEFNGRSNST
ncbi:MAG: hypothetical protein JF615_12520 [Asticcacaulis sp.]|nr:hypothetical protein [Asticcacaulis sp.]